MTTDRFRRIALGLKGVIESAQPKSFFRLSWSLIHHATIADGGW
jgi:hypothetical protein